METTEWRTVPQFPMYEASRDGRVRRKDTGKVLKLTMRKGKSSSVMVKLNDDNYKPHTRGILAVIASAWGVEVPAGCRVVRRDGMPRNNALDNIMVVGNGEFARANGHSEARHGVLRVDSSGEIIRMYSSVHDAGADIGCKYTTTWNRVNGRVRDAVLPDGTILVSDTVTFDGDRVRLPQWAVDAYEIRRKKLLRGYIRELSPRRVAAISKRKKPVLRIDRQGNIVARYAGVTDAAAACYMSVDTMCRHCHGYVPDCVLPDSTVLMYEADAKRTAPTRVRVPRRITEAFALRDAQEARRAEKEREKAAARKRMARGVIGSSVEVIRVDAEGHVLAVYPNVKACAEDIGHHVNYVIFRCRNRVRPLIMQDGTALVYLRDAKPRMDGTVRLPKWLKEEYKK